MKCSDYIARLLSDNGITDVFSVVGGGAMHLNDSFAHFKGVSCTYFMHEQGAAIAAEAYARIEDKIPVVCVTTGPGGTNALTGVLCAWLDNIPMVVISGQVKTTSTIASTGLKLRQFGEQEYNIVDVVKEMTKYAVMVQDVKDVQYCIEKAIYEAKTGRRGPCWVDIPLDIQGANIDDIEELRGFQPENISMNFDGNMVIELLQNSKRPVILAGSAVRTAVAHKDFLEVCEQLAVPVLAAKSVADILPNSHELYFGNFGINGGRAGNFIVQNADCILVLGCRLSFGQIGFNYKQFSPKSKKIVVDVDENELKKNTVAIDCPINVDIKEFLSWLKVQSIDIQMDSNWINYCGELREKFPIYKKEFANAENVNAYYFAQVLSSYMDENAICILGNSCSSISIKQCGIKYTEQRMWGNINCGTMGYDIPAAIGAFISGKKQVICCAGDGSFQMNMQELQTIVNYNIPIKLFVFNNGGYRSIVLSQTKNFGRLSGCTKETGLTLPSLEKISYAYGIPFFKCDKNENLYDCLKKIFATEGYVICEIIEDMNHEIQPKLGNRVLEDGRIESPVLDDLCPFLDRDIYQKYTKYENYVNNINLK